MASIGSGIPNTIPISPARNQAGRGVAGPVGRHSGCGKRIAKHALFVAAALHRGRYPHRLAVFGDGAAGDINARSAQSFHDGVVGQDRGGVLGIDQLLDVVAHRLRRVRFAAVGGRDRSREEIFQFKDAAIGRHVFVGGDARHGRFMHLDGVGHGLEIQRPQMRHAMGEEAILLAHDLGRDLQDGAGALIERAHQPGRVLQAIGEIGFVAVLADRLRQFGIVGLVDQDPRQRVAVELDMPAAVGARPHIDVGHHGLNPRRRRTSSPASDRGGGFRRSCRRCRRRRRRRACARRRSRAWPGDRDVRPAPASPDRSGRVRAAGSQGIRSNCARRRRAGRISAAPREPPRHLARDAPSRSAAWPRSAGR